MGKILIGALVCATVAGVVYYLYNTEEVNNKLEKLKGKASDALDQAKNKFGKQAEEVQTWAQS